MGLIVKGQQAPFSCLIDQCNEPIDTIDLENIHQYQPLTTLSLGNIGLPQFNLIPKFDSIYNYRTLSFIPDQYQAPLHYDVKTPFTSLSYVLGSKSEQLLSVFHTQNLSPHTNFALKVNKVKSQGLYLNQLTNNNYLSSDIWHKSKNQKYYIDLSFQYSRIFNELNGGITADSIFEQDTLLNRNRQLMPVNLENASTTIKKSLLQLDQYVSLLNALDSSLNGTELKVGLLAKATEIDKRYKDSLLNLNYYTVILNDSIITNDKNYYRGAGGKFYFDYTYKKDSLSINIKPYMDYEIKHILNEELDTINANSMIGLDAEVNLKKNKLLFNYQNWLSGYRRSDYLAQIDWTSSISKFIIHATGKLSSYHPSWDLLYYKGNNIQWTNTFTPTQLRYASASLKYPKTHSSISYTYTDAVDAVVFNNLAQPQQAPGISQFMQTTFKQDFAYKKFNMNVSATYQYMGGYQITQLPKIVATSQLYFKGPAFNNNLHYLIGVEGVYYSSFEAMGFSPMAYSYYLSSSKVIGNYAQVNVFMNFRIRSVRLFAKVTHLNAGLFGYRYYGAYNYPLKDRTLQLGLNWNFLN